MFKLFIYSLKTLFKSKVFIAVFSVILLLIGTTYTLLESTNASFQNATIALFDNKKLHDEIIKSNIQINKNSKLEVEATKVSEYLNQDQKKIFIFDVKVTEGKLDYQDYQGRNFKISVEKNDFNQAKIDAKNKIKTQIKYEVLNNLNQKFRTTLQNAYKDEIVVQTTESLTVKKERSKEVLKVVYHDSQKGVNEIESFKGKSSLSTYWDNQKMQNQLNIMHQDLPETQDQPVDSSKVYKWTIGTGNQAKTIIDPSSYEAIVSPTFAKSKNINPISGFEKQYLINSLILFDDNQDEKDSLIEKYQNNIVKVGSIPFVVVGIGIRPDFAYPIIDVQNAVPDVKNQGIIFVNENGFAKTKDSFRGNFQENYFSLKFKDNVSNARKTQIVKDIQDHFKNNSTLKNLPSNVIPDNLRPITSWNDRNDPTLLAQERVIFLKNFQRSLEVISYFLTTSLIIFAAFIIIFSFRVLISNRISKLSTLIALGYTKNKIAWSMGFASSVFMLIPTFLGYIIGISLQSSFSLIFASFWTIPNESISFSWLAFIVVVIMPLISFTILIWFITYFTLSGKLMNMINNTKTSNNLLLNFFMKPFVNFGAKMKYGIALTFKNVTKVIVVFLASIFSMVAMIIAISNIGKSNDALQKTSSLSNYVYKVDLYSPTQEGGLYQRINKEKLGEDVSIQAFENNYDQSKKQDNKNIPYFYAPSANDNNFSPVLDTQDFNKTLQNPEGVKKIATFLKNQIQVQYLMENNQLGNSTWNVAKRLMPENQLNLSNESNKDTITQVEKLVGKKLTNMNNQEKQNAFLNLLKQNKINPYLLTYNSVITNQEDETYSYIDTRINNENYKITGIKPNSKYINLKKSLINDLQNFNKPNVYPVVINKFISEKHNLQIGSVFDSYVDNELKRNFASKIKTKIKKHFEVVSVIDSYDNKGLFTLEKFAKQVIGVPKEKQQNFFNGVFTKKQGTNSALINSVPLYSPSGIYIGSDSVLPSEWENAIKNIMNQDINGLRTNIFPNVTSSNYQSSFMAKYTATSYVSILENVEWSLMNDYAFQNTSRLISSFLVTLEAILICVSFLFAIIISVILITSNRKRIATLWALGYRQNEIIRIFLTTQALPLVLATILSIPFSIGFFAIMRTFVMSFGNILIPFGLTALGTILPILLISGIFIFSIVIGILSLGSKTTLEAFKNE